jgi:hypothetical protein|tara:strand:+ start:2010 stop:2750 length:741 start_codon:yes stop_codon:yes gene_type:complete
MATPTTRTELKKYCLRRLGAPVVEINVDEDQVDDRIDDALEFYRDYHYDGSERTFLKHQVTEADKTNKYIDIPPTVMGVINIFPIGTGLQANNLFNLRYQISLNEVHDWASEKIQNYVASMERISLLEELLVGKQPLRFNRHTDKMYIDMDWNRVSVGEYIIVECYQVLDPNTHNSVWGDWWLRQYATALIKRQWGENMKKFEGMQLPGGVTFNGQTIWSEAQEEILRLEEEVQKKFSMPAMDMIG